MKQKISLITKIFQSLGLANGIRLITGHVFKKERISLFVKELNRRITIRPWTGDFATLRQVIWDKEYDFELENVATIVDLGANIGISTLVLENKFPKAKIIAVEPSQSNFELLSGNTGHVKNILLLQSAVWYKDGFVEIVDSNAKSNEFKVSDSNKKADVLSIGAISIPSLLAKYHLNQIDLLKIDIEGAEEEIFKKGDLSWLADVKCIVIETHSNEFRNELLQIMAPGFTQTVRGEKLLFFNKQKTNDHS